ncbi:tenascin-R-like [Ruditapes philippinarum]|uniref:tenascin-R-like n=1 Tax=Ruditapes philippinarum TaxID=129788 RepID=UPI00295AF6B3|nr:tenascin-R-like [Ruditapes philippinarum]
MKVTIKLAFTLFTLLPIRKASQYVAIWTNQAVNGLLYKGGVSIRDFYKTWDEYETGFGNLRDNFYLGNRFIYEITSQDKYQLRVDLTSYQGESAYAEYSQIFIGDSESSYKLYVGGYSGTAGDALMFQNGMKFTTMDRKNDPTVLVIVQLHFTVRGGTIHDIIQTLTDCIALSTTERVQTGMNGRDTMLIWRPLKFVEFIVSSFRLIINCFG